MLAKIELRDIQISVRNGTLRRDIERDPKLLDLVLLFVEDEVGNVGTVEDLRERIDELERDLEAAKDDAFDSGDYDELADRLAVVEAKIKRIEKRDKAA